MLGTKINLHLCERSVSRDSPRKPCFDSFLQLAESYVLLLVFQIKPVANWQWNFLKTNLHVLLHDIGLWTNWCILDFQAWHLREKGSRKIRRISSRNYKPDGHTHILFVSWVSRGAGEKLQQPACKSDSGIISERLSSGSVLRYQRLEPNCLSTTPTGSNPVKGGIWGMVPPTHTLL